MKQCGGSVHHDTPGICVWDFVFYIFGGKSFEYSCWNFVRVDRLLPNTVFLALMQLGDYQNYICFNLHTGSFSSIFLASLLAVNCMAVEAHCTTLQLRHYSTLLWQPPPNGFLHLILGTADGTQEFLLAQPVAALLPDITELLQGRTNFFSWGDSQATQVMAADRETRDGPGTQFSQELPLTLILQELQHFALRVWLPGLQM